MNLSRLKTYNDNHQTAIRLFFATLFFTLIYIFYTWPLALVFTSEVPGLENSDVYIFLWNTYLVENTLSSGNFPFSGLLFYPEEFSTLWHTSTWLMGLYSMLFENSASAVNSFLLINFVLSALGAYLLCRLFIKNPFLCLLAGFIFAFSPWKTMRLMEHYNLVMTAAIPFYFYFFIKLNDLINKAEFGRKFYLMLSGVLLAFMLSLMSDLILTAYLVLFSFLYIAFYFMSKNQSLKLKYQQLLNALYSSKDKINRTTVLKYAVIFLLTILSLHFSIDFLKRNFDDLGGFWWGAGWMNMFVPWHHLQIADFFGEGLINQVHPRGMEQSIYLGISMLLLATIALVYRKSVRLPSELKILFACGLVFLFLTMPEIRFPGFKLNNPLSILHFLPGSNNFRCPGRYIMPVYLLLPIVFLYILEHSPLRKIFPLIFILFILEYLPSGISRIDTKAVPEVVKLAKETDARTLMTIPFGIRDGFELSGEVEEQLIWHQSIHEKKLIGGYLARVPQKVWDSYLQDPVCLRLMKLQEEAQKELPELSHADIEAFFEKFNPELIIITAAYRNSAVEAFILENFSHRITRKQISEDALLIELN